MRTLISVASAALLAGGLAAGTALAQNDWPTASDRINIVVPFDTGGSTDRLARHIASNLSEHLNGAPVTVINRPGASGAVGSSWLLTQPGDGSHFLVTHAVPYLANSVLSTDLPMEWEDFTPINIQWPQSSLLFASKDSGFETVQELFESIRENPGEHSVAILHGSGAHLQLLLMMDALEIPRENVRWVTFEGGGPQRSSVAGGTVTFTMTAAAGSLGISDLITPLAIHAEEGDEDWPGVPYLNDELESAYGVTVPGVGNTYAALLAPTSFRENHPERFEAFVNGYREMVESEAYRASAAENALGAVWYGPERSKEILDEGFVVMSEHSDTFED
jgi:putative tricarboxylic transport membrane protein